MFNQSKFNTPKDSNTPNMVCETLDKLSEGVLIFNKMEVIWKDIVGYEGLYQINDYGIIKSIDRYVIRNTKLKNGKYVTQKLHINSVILKPNIHFAGYYVIDLTKSTIRNRFFVHRLVALNFIPNPENKREVNHIDFNKLNNCVNNLEWATPSENMKHSSINGRLFIPCKKGDKIKPSKITNEIALNIRSLHHILTYKKMAEIYSISTGLVSKIVNNKGHKINEPILSNPVKRSF